MKNQFIKWSKHSHSNHKEKGSLRDTIKRKTDLIFKLTQNIRVRTRQVFKAQNVNNLTKAFDLIGCSHSFFKSWNIHQVFGDMTLQKIWYHMANYLPITSINI